MYIYLEENTNTYHKGQLTPFFIAILTILIIGIMVTVNIGKVSLIKTHNSNAADAGALAAASIAASTFDNLGMMAETMYAASAEYAGTVTGLLEEIRDLLDLSSLFQYLGLIFLNLSHPLTMVPYLGKWLYLLFQILSWGAFGTGQYFFTVAWKLLGDTVEPLLEEWQSQMMSFYESLKESIEESIGVLAPQQANSYALMNSGISSMLDSEGSDYENYKSVLENGGNSFSFTDGQERDHSVSVSVALDQIASWHLYKTVDDLGELQDKIFDYDIISTVMSALFYVMMLVEWNYAQAAVKETECGSNYNWHVMACPPLCVCVIPTVAIQYFMPWWWHLAMFALMIGNFVLLKPIIDDIEDGIQENGVVSDPSGDEILVTISDVSHSRNVDSVTVIQAHDGANLGLWNTNYPQMRSSASSTFEGGSVDGHGASQTHDPRLTGAN